MTRKSFLLLTLLVAFVIGAFAADVTGKWTAQVPGRQGNTQEVTFNFKQAGTALTGSVTTGQGETAIADGKVDGAAVSFTVTGGRGPQTYKGTLGGEEIKFTREGGRGPVEFVAKRAK